MTFEGTPTRESWLNVNAPRHPSEEISPAILFDEFVEEEWESFARDEKGASR